MCEFGRRFQVSPDEVRGRIMEAIAFFVDLRAQAHQRSEVKIYLVAQTLQFSFYQFNRRVVFASYKHRPGRGSIITLLADRGGELYSWISDEWDGIAGGEKVRER